MKQVNRILAYPLYVKHVLSNGGEEVTTAIGNLASIVKLYTLYDLQLLHKRHCSDMWLMDPLSFLV
jgi:hypothetical protein